MATARMLTGVAANNYYLLDKLGAGTYGSVHKVQHKSTGEFFAMKFMQRNAWKYQGNAEKELKVLYKLKHHKNLAKWFDIFLTGERFDRGEGYRYQAMTMELCDTDLAGYLTKRQPSS